MQIDGHTALLGLIGNPVGHTLSPAIHNTLAESMGDNLVYLPFPVEEAYLEDALKGAYALGVLGLNVTVPYKQAVMAQLLSIDSMAARIGAVNTLVRADNGFVGYNTDILGLYRALIEEGIVFEGEEMVLLGAGGAARAAAFLCAEKGAAKVYLLNRSLNKAVHLADEVNSSFGRDCILPMALCDFDRLPQKKMTVIQGTSAGLYPNVDQAVIEDARFYERVAFGYDLVYKPAETKFMKLVTNAGGKACNGLSMLLYQGIAAYELFLHKEVPAQQVQIVRNHLTEKVRA